MVKRVNFIMVVVIAAFTVIILNLFYLTMFKGSYYEEKLDVMTDNEVDGSSTPRGRIYDRNMNLLVDNRSIPVIYYKNVNDLNTFEEAKLALEITDHIEVDDRRLTERNIKDYIIARDENQLNNLITSDEWLQLKNRRITENDVYNFKLERITDKEVGKLTSKEKEAAYIYYLMKKGYSYEEKEIKKDNVDEKEIAYISENISKLNGFNIKYDWERVYLYGDTFKTILGSLGDIPSEEKEEYLKNGYSLNDVVGTSFIEKEYEDILRGTKEKYEVTKNNLVMTSSGKRGKDIVLTIDIKLQQEIDKILEEELIKAKYESATEYLDHAFVVIQEPNTGEILAMSSKQVIKSGGKYKAYDYSSNIPTDAMTVGSVVKGASMLTAYKNGAIKIGEVMTDSCIKIYSKPQKCSWSKLGRINDLDALAYSSNIYQFKAAMKVANFKYSYNKKFNVTKNDFDIYHHTFEALGLGVKTGIDLPSEAVGNRGTNYSSDLFLNYAIGQYDTYTVLQLSQYINTIASNGKRYKPHLLKSVYDSSDGEELGKKLYDVEPVVLNALDIDSKYIKRVQKGFRSVMTYGLGKNFMGDVDSPCGKTGTSESFYDSNGDGKVDVQTASNAFVGYAPYKNPKMSIAVMVPNIVNNDTNGSGRSYVNKRITRMISEKFFELY